MSFTEYDPDGFGSRRTDERLSIYQDGNARINKQATQRWFDGVQNFRVLVDEEQQLLAIDPDPPEDSHTLAVSHGDSGGAEIHTAGALQEFGVDIEAMEDTHYRDLRKDDNTGYILADLDGLPGIQDASDEDEHEDLDEDDVEASGEDAHEENREELDHTDEADLRWAYEQTETITEAAEYFSVTESAIHKRLTEAGIHQPQQYSSDDDQDDAGSDQEQLDLDEYDASPPPELDDGTVAAVAQHYDTLEEVADDLEVTVGRAAAILDGHQQNLLVQVDIGDHEIDR